MGAVCGTVISAGLEQSVDAAFWLVAALFLNRHAYEQTCPQRACPNSSKLGPNRRRCDGVAAQLVTHGGPEPTPTVSQPRSLQLSRPRLTSQS